MRSTISKVTTKGAGWGRLGLHSGLGTGTRWSLKNTGWVVLLSWELFNVLRNGSQDTIPITTSPPNISLPSHHHHPHPHKQPLCHDETRECVAHTSSIHSNKKVLKHCTKLRRFKAQATNGVVCVCVLCNVYTN